MSAGELIVAPSQDASLLVSASAPVLQPAISGVPPGYELDDGDDLDDGTKPHEYHLLVRTLSERSLGYLQLLQGDNFGYQHLDRARPRERPPASTGMPPAANSSSAGAFKTLFDGRRIPHIFSVTDRFPSDVMQPTAMLLGPGDYASGLKSRTTGAMATVKSRRPRTSGAADRATASAIGPGTYNPRLSGGRYAIGEYDKRIPSGISRTTRAPAFRSNESISLGGDSLPSMPQLPRMPGASGYHFGSMDPLANALGEETRGSVAIGASTATPPSIGPGAYHPKPMNPHTYNVRILARPPEHKTGG